MGNETKGHGLIGACTHNGSAVAVVQVVGANSNITKMKIKGQGKFGNSVNQMVARDSTANLRFVGQPPIAAGTKGDLIVPVIRGDAVTIDQNKWKNMIAFDWVYAATSGDGGHDYFDQSFEVEDDMVTDNFVFTPAG